MKAIRIFDQLVLTRHGSQADLKIARSTPLAFGNPQFGVRILQSNPYSGLGWPARMLIAEDSGGGIQDGWTGFDFVLGGHRIASRYAQFKMASKLATFIAAARRTEARRRF